MLELQILLLLIPEYLCLNFSPFLTISPQLAACCKKLPKLIFIHLFCITKFGFFCSSDLPLFSLKPTKEVPVLIDCLILPLSGMTRPGLVIVVVVVVNVLAVEGLAELFGQLIISDLLINNSQSI